MLTAHKIKVFQSLNQKKFRQKYNLFFVEGNKIIRELKNSPYEVVEIFSTCPEHLDFENTPIHPISERELKKISFLQNPKDSIAVCKIKEEKILETSKIQLVLDGIQDPGNLGTIIRLADWFGITQMICSEDTADYYNPKVIQASMGSFTRVNILYKNLVAFFQENPLPIIGTDMDGENLYTTEFPKDFYLVLGNEGNGIRKEIESQLTQKITIPRFSNHQSTESLNVSMAAGIILGQIFSKKP